MFDWIKKGLSDKDGNMDEARVTAVALVFAFIGHSFVAIILNPAHPFDMIAFGTGAGALCAGVGALFGLRKDN